MIKFSYVIVWEHDKKNGIVSFYGPYNTVEKAIEYASDLGFGELNVDYYIADLIP